MPRQSRGHRALDARAWWERAPELLEQIECEIAVHPLLRLHWGADGPIIKGQLLLDQSGVVFDRYGVRIIFPKNYPDDLPIVYETQDRIPRIEERHVNKRGDACLMIPEDWQLNENDRSFHAFIMGPVRNFFLSQTYFEEHGCFPFGERPHGLKGLIQAYSEHLGVDPDLGTIRAWLACLTPGKMKGHWTCPCGSRERLRDCCSDRIANLRQRIPPSLAASMRYRLQEHVRAEQRVPNVIEKQCRVIQRSVTK